MASLTLGDLFSEAPTDIASRPVAGLADDSRHVAPGYAFLAVPGSQADGAGYVRDAVRRGASAVIGAFARPADLPDAVAFLPVPDARAALAGAAARLHPGQPDTVVAVTGTSGKSSVADFTRQLLAGLGHPSASLGTIGLVTSAGAEYGSLTTPGPISLHLTLDRLAQEGVTYLALEASSHGIDQRRLDGVRLSAAAFTNLGRDHLDYHETPDAYLAAKIGLFDRLLPAGSAAVINADGAEAERVIAAARARGHRVTTTGRAGDTVRLVEARPDGFGQHLSLRMAGGRRYDILLPLVGGFQVENALVAAGLALAVAPGRGARDRRRPRAPRRRARAPRAHRRGERRARAWWITRTSRRPWSRCSTRLRPFATGRLRLHPGLRWRPGSGQAAADGGHRGRQGRHRDRHGRQPPLGRIRPRSGPPSSPPHPEALRDRRSRAEAIAHRRAGRCGPGDVLVVAGKGHETGQIVGERTLPFSDGDAVRTGDERTFEHGRTACSGRPTRARGAPWRAPASWARLGPASAACRSTPGRSGSGRPVLRDRRRASRPTVTPSRARLLARGAAAALVRRATGARGSSPRRARWSPCLTCWPRFGGARPGGARPERRPDRRRHGLGRQDRHQGGAPPRARRASAPPMPPSPPTTTIGACR